MTEEDVLAFWFEGDANLFRRERWFFRDDTFDAAIRERFGFTVEAGVDGALDSWANTPQGTLALVIVLDQFPRNLHRDSYLAFSGDAHARRIARNAIAGGVDAHLTPVQRIFLYLPFCHSEDIADQDHAVKLFDGLGDDPQVEQSAKSAYAHRDVIRRFGRFPHRNAALGRENTPAELTYLAEPGSGFGGKRRPEA